jgi:NADH-quinone oxidoreductase subunit J
MGIHWHSLFFYVMAIAACGFALAVVISNNIVHMALALVMSLGAVAGLFFLAGADFVGALQLMIYVGGTLVLLVFGVMLTARGPFVTMKTSAGQWLLTGIVGAALLSVLLWSALSVDRWAGQRVAAAAAPAESDESMPTAGPIGLGLLGIRVDRLDSERAGDPLARGMSGYLLPFEVISVHLVVVLIGAAYLARARRRRAAQVPQLNNPDDPPLTPND